MSRIAVVSHDRKRVAWLPAGEHVDDHEAACLADVARRLGRPLSIAETRAQLRSMRRHKAKLGSEVVAAELSSQPEQTVEPKSEPKLEPAPESEPQTDFYQVATRAQKVAAEAAIHARLGYLLLQDCKTEADSRRAQLLASAGFIHLAGAVELVRPAIKKAELRRVIGMQPRKKSPVIGEHDVRRAATLLAALRSVSRSNGRRSSHGATKRLAT
jgi:hypothetical protein